MVSLEGLPFIEVNLYSEFGDKVTVNLIDVLQELS
jgi:hypothetical protein